MSFGYRVLVLCVYFVTPTPPIKANTDYVKTQDGDLAFPDDLGIGKFSRRSYHSHYHHHHHSPDFYHSSDFQHSPEYHMHDHGDGEDSTRSNNSLEIPLDFIKNLNNYNVSDLLLNFVDDDVAEPMIQNRFLGDERSAAVMAKEAGCLPELQTVPLVTNDDPSVLYIPQCTRVERCGGCCSHVLLSCQPTATETLSFKVLKTQYTGTKLKVVAKEVMQVEKHTKCKCDCRVRPEDCNVYQEYRKSECRCACTNHDEEKKCYKNNQTKLWNPDVCACQCRQVTQCSTGSQFDQNECKCKTVPMRRRFAEFERKDRAEPPPVVPFNEEY